MAKILILGGTGQTGRLLSRLLLEYSEAEVAIATRHPETGKRYADELNQTYAGLRASAVYADASDAETLENVFRGHDLVVVAAPVSAYTKLVAQAAIRAGTDYLDVQLSAEKLAYLRAIEEDIRRAGRVFITEAGFHPGLPSALIRYAAARLDSIESAITAGYLNMGKDLPYTEAVDELIACFKEYNGQVYRNGHWTKPTAYEVRKIDFGGDIGLKRCYSMFFDELLELPDIYPSLKNLGFYMAESHWVTDWVIMPIVFMCLKIKPNAIKPIGRFLWWGMRTFHKPPYRVELLAKVSGSKNGQKQEIRISVSHADGYALTAIPVAAALLQYLDGSARKPGLWMMGHLVEPDRLMKDIEQMGCTSTFFVNNS